MHLLIENCEYGCLVLSIHRPFSWFGLVSLKGDHRVSAKNLQSTLANERKMGIERANKRSNKRRGGRGRKAKRRRPQWVPWALCVFRAQWAPIKNGSLLGGCCFSLILLSELYIFVVPGNIGGTEHHNVHIESCTMSMLSVCVCGACVEP